MRLFVVNCTGQHRLVNYRLDFTVDDMGRRTSERHVPYKWLNVPARTQIQFGGDLYPDQFAELVNQLEATCGAVPSNDVKTAKKMGVVKMIWSQDKPITLSVLKDVFDHNQNLLTQQGDERRELLAMVADAGLTALIGHTPQKMEVEFEQKEEDPIFPGRLTQGLRVVRPDAPNAPPQRGRRSRAA